MFLQSFELLKHFASFMWRLQEACEGYRRELFSHLTDKPTEAVSVGPDPGASGGWADHMHD